ncbi:MAG: CBS domain-containing protein [Ectothiorhodospiraceae bacterium]
MDTRLGTILREKPQALYTVSADATVQEAVNIMAEANVGCIVVMAEGKLQGLFTERDLMTRVIGAGRQPTETPIGDVMTSAIATVTPKLTVGEAMALCTDRRLRHLPVYEGDTMLGIVSAGDLTKWAISEQEHTIDELSRYIYGETS